MTIARRLTSTGTMYISGEFDEVTLSVIRLTTTTYYAVEFDEYTINGGSTQMRETNAGVVLVSNELDEYNKPT